MTFSLSKREREREREREIYSAKKRQPFLEPEGGLRRGEYLPTLSNGVDSEGLAKNAKLEPRITKQYFSHR